VPVLQEVALPGPLPDHEHSNGFQCISLLHVCNALLYIQRVYTMYACAHKVALSGAQNQNFSSTGVLISP